MLWAQTRSGFSLSKNSIQARLTIFFLGPRPTTISSTRPHPRGGLPVRRMPGADFSSPATCTTVCPNSVSRRSQRLAARAAPPLLRWSCSKIIFNSLLLLSSTTDYRPLITVFRPLFSISRLGPPRRRFSSSSTAPASAKKEAFLPSSNSGSGKRLGRRLHPAVSVPGVARERSADHSAPPPD